MANLHIRDIDDHDYEVLRRVARENNRSAAAQIRTMIAELKTSSASADRAVAELMEFRKQHRIKPRKGEDALSMVRAVR